MYEHEIKNVILDHCLANGVHNCSQFVKALNARPEQFQITYQAARNWFDERFAPSERVLEEIIKAFPDEWPAAMAADCLRVKIQHINAVLEAVQG